MDIIHHINNAIANKDLKGKTLLVSNKIYKFLLGLHLRNHPDTKTIDGNLYYKDVKVLTKIKKDEQNRRN